MLVDGGGNQAREPTNLISYVCVIGSELHAVKTTYSQDNYDPIVIACSQNHMQSGS
jgi:hypothetical protein